MNDPNLPVDCWVIPRDNPGGITPRWALYKLIVQGFRRCQGIGAPPLFELGGIRPKFREFFSGVPLWPDGAVLSRTHPLGYRRLMDESIGAFYWAAEDDTALIECGQWTLGYWPVLGCAGGSMRDSRQ